MAHADERTSGSAPSGRSGARDTSPVGTRVMSSRLIGRTGELAELEAALREVRDGCPSVVALGGESGVGKTRLVRAFAEGCAGEARFLIGECVELDEGELPYAPLTAALREPVRAQDPALERLSPGARAALAALLPSFGSPGAPPGEEDSAQLRLFEAVLELLELLGEERPVVLVIEDLHWADRSTRAFTAFLARSLRHERVLFAFTYRSDELHRRHPLLPLLSELERREQTRRLALGPWGREELSHALADILGATPSPELLERMFARSEGNPLYTEELLAAGLDGRGAAPRSLRDAFMLRIERLPPDARRALRVLAVARRATERLLAELAGLGADETTEALRLAVEERVIEPCGQGQLGYRHALLREVVYEELLPGERAALHLRIAQALAARPAGDDGDYALTAQIAAHARAGGDRRLALQTAIAAAAQASKVHAHGEAAELLEHALQAFSQMPDAAEIAGVQHLELLERAAREHDLHGQRARAESILQAALGEVEEETDPVRAAALLEELARTQWNLARGDEALATARRALALLPDGIADAQRAHLLAWLARTTLLRGQYRDAVDASRQALENIAASGAGVHVESAARNTLGMALSGCGEVESGLEQLRRSLELARASADDGLLESAYANLGDVLLHLGRTGEALEVTIEGLEAIPAHLHGGRTWLSTSVAETAFHAGQWDRAEALLRRSERATEGRALLNRSLRRAELALGQGRLEDAERDLGEIEPLVEQSLEPQFHACYGLAVSSLARRRGRHADARAAIEDSLDRIEFCSDDIRRVTAIAAAGVAIEADIAQFARDRSDAAALDQALALAEPLIERVRASEDSGGPVEQAWRASADAELARALDAEDPSLWSEAAQAWDRIERPYPSALEIKRLGEAHLRAGQREEAAEALRTARAQAAQLGAGWLTAEIDTLAAGARLALAAEDPAGPAGETQPQPFGLTPRELEVLALVARGATNRTIGEQLFMAEKTASVHVSRILGKLGVSSRTQAAAVAHRAGLAGSRAAGASDDQEDRGAGAAG